MSKMEEICSVSFVNHEAASELLREFTGKEGGLATVDWYLLRNKIADAISMARVDEREKCRQLLSEAEKREREARVKALEEAAAYHEYRADNHAAAHRHVVSDFHELMEKTHRDAAADIRALQSEDR